ncbi:MAG: V-type ATP synthase subunit F [Candidatus Omnitrophica bacterium]|nr:V-type ATP synthase subunit F [Candidatus Omnitrophota bacterium]
MTFFCIADKESSLGFKLSGIETREVSTRLEALEALRVARATKDIGVIIITEKAAAHIQEEVKAHITEKPIPLVLEVPSRGQAPKRKSAAELLKELAGLGI